MCKLFAYVNQETKVIPTHIATRINKTLRHLFYINSYGQIDGSGIMWMNKAGTTDFLKAPLPSPIFMELKSFDKIKDNLANNKFVAGHTRYSTVGGNNWENSHPFEHGEYLGIQNGTIRNSHKSLVLGQVSPCDVDSASVFWSFSQQGVADTLNRYEGEGVFMFMNKEEKSFNIVKNIYRTLYVAKINTLDAYILATDKFALEFVAERQGLKFDSVKPVSDDTLITYGFDNTIVKQEMEVPGPVLTNYGSYYSTRSYSSGYSSNTYKPTKTTVVSGKTKGTVNVFNSKSKKTVVSGNTSKVQSNNATKEEPSGSSQEKSYYVQDCDICSSPIYTNSLAYADDSNLLRCKYVSCSCCEHQLKEFTGSEVFKIDFSGVTT